MGKQSKRDLSGIDLLSKELESLCGGLPPELCQQLTAEQQVIKIKVEKRKFGREVTIIEGFDSSYDLKKIASYLKSKLAAGGTYKEGRIEIQGDHRHRIKYILVNDFGISPENIVFIEER
ncbi:MAG: stress response translation initiation inhibitor YciH [Desulfurococcales archaeon ex4484_42]|nr:MAG: stress response translation initiation inhibitor YciH [Desulfurococcales archaeon ex4484_42]